MADPAVVVEAEPADVAAARKLEPEDSDLVTLESQGGHKGSPLLLMLL